MILELKNNQVDIGVRVELPAIIWDNFSKKIYEPKIWYRSKRYGDTTRMFCFNERGGVVTENTDGVLTVNGHSYRDAVKKDTEFQLCTAFDHKIHTAVSMTPYAMQETWQALPTSYPAAAYLYSDWETWKTEEEQRKNVLHSQQQDLQ